MAIQTTTTWSTDNYANGTSFVRASLERATGPSDLAELVVGSETILVGVEQLRELSQAAGLIADEIEASK